MFDKIVIALFVLAFAMIAVLAIWAYNFEQCNPINPAAFYDIERSK
jgi:hypothetical protein